MQNNSKRTGPLVVAVASIKGGVGKTSLAVLLARRIGEQGRRALLVDLDPQASAGRWIGARFPAPQRWQR